MRIIVSLAVVVFALAMVATDATVVQGVARSGVAPEPETGRSFLAQLAKEAPHPLVGKPAPTFTLNLLDGGKVDLSEELGKKIIVLDFWASWCPPCRRALPIAVSISGQYKEKNKDYPVVFYGVNLREAPETVKDFLQRVGLKFPVAMDAEGNAANLYKVQPIPETVIIGKDGTVQAVHIGIGPDYEADLKSELETLTSGKKLVSPPPAK
jgi:peroxiredoxin